MTVGKALAIGCGALVLVVGLTLGDTGRVAITGGSQAGSIACTGLSGTMKFDPPLTSNGTAPEVAPIRLTMTHCTVSAGGPGPRTGHGTAAIPMRTNNCNNLALKSKTAVSFVIRWSPTSDGSSSVRFVGFAPTKTNDTGFRLGGTKTTVRGSYPGDNHGASSKATITSTTTPSKLAGACASASGLEVLKIESGSLELK